MCWCVGVLLFTEVVYITKMTSVQCMDADRGDKYGDDAGLTASRLVSHWLTASFTRTFPKLTMLLLLLLLLMMMGEAALPLLKLSVYIRRYL